MRRARNINALPLRKGYIKTSAKKNKNPIYILMEIGDLPLMKQMLSPLLRFFFYFPPQAENAALAGRITLIGESSRLERAARCALM